MLMACASYAEEIIMKCEGAVTYTYDANERQSKVFDYVLKYEDTLFGNPTITIRESGAWKPWCGTPQDNEEISNTLEMGEMGAACLKIKENDLFYGEVNHVVDFILRTYSIKSEVFTRKTTNDDWIAEADWNCELLD